MNIKKDLIKCFETIGYVKVNDNARNIKFKKPIKIKGIKCYKVVHIYLAGKMLYIYNEIPDEYGNVNRVIDLQEISYIELESIYQLMGGVNNGRYKEDRRISKKNSRTSKAAQSCKKSKAKANTKKTKKK